ncbi:MAG: hypothetical protein FJW14_15475 [Acidimicrobiia bacterium]|nr:hypothetical protein [Acidimicrobiia bacterium]
MKHLLAVLVAVASSSAVTVQIAVSSNDNKAVPIDGVNTVPPNPRPDTATILDLGATLLRVGRSRSTVALDVYNAFNSNAVLQEATAYGRYREPVQILQARFARISVQFDF